MPVEEQVAVIYAGTKGYLDKIPLEEVKRFEAEYLEYVKMKEPTLLSKIATDKKLNEEIEGMLRKTLDEFSAGFKVAESATAAL